MGGVDEMASHPHFSCSFVHSTIKKFSIVAGRLHGKISGSVPALEANCHI